jgi:hypothetical protein
MFVVYNNKRSLKNDHTLVPAPPDNWKGRAPHRSAA